MACTMIRRDLRGPAVSAIEHFLIISIRRKERSALTPKTVRSWSIRSDLFSHRWTSCHVFSGALFTPRRPRCFVGAFLDGPCTLARSPTSCPLTKNRYWCARLDAPPHETSGTSHAPRKKRGERRARTWPEDRHFSSILPTLRKSRFALRFFSRAREGVLEDISPK